MAKSSDQKILLKIKHVQILLVIAAVVYPGWTIIHHLVFNDVKDSYIERLGVSAYFLFTILVTHIFSHKLTHEKKLLILQTGRWIITIHYFSIVYRNHLAVQYAMVAYFIVFTVSLLFENPKYFLYYALYVLSISMLIKSDHDYLPGYVFQLGLATCLGISFINISNKYKLLKAVEESERVFRTIFENSGVGIALINTQGVILKANTYLTQLFKENEQSLLGNNFNIFVADNKKNIFENIKESHLLQEEIKIVDKDSQFGWIRLNSTLIKSQDQKDFAIAIVENITQQKQAEEKIQQQQLTLNYSAKMTALGEMASGIAHEINNPLSTINVTTMAIFNSLKKKDYQDDFIYNGLDKINKTVSRIAKIIKGLKNFSRDASADESSPNCLNEIIHDSLSLCSENLKNNNVDVILNLAQSPLTINCRPAEISQVLLNLISNASSAMSQQSEKRQLNIKTYIDKESVKLEVINSGPPIPEDIKAKIFQPFFTTKPVGEGTGLGLSISVGIMKSHQGSIQLKENSPQTNFILTFPYNLQLNKNEAS